MKIRYVFVSVLLVAQAISHAEVTGPLSSLKNEWGKGCPMDFRKKVYKTVPAVLKKGGDADVVEWYQDVASYPDLMDATGTTSWMQEKVELLLTQAMYPPVNASTNCWLAAAELLNRYHQMALSAESNANVKVSISLIKTDPKKFNELFYGRKAMMKKAWNLKCVEASLTRVVTNEFPKSILPSLSESDREKMLTEVLVRAGLAEADASPGLADRCRVLPVSLGVVSFLLLVGLVVWKRTA